MRRQTGTAHLSRMGAVATAVLLVALSTAGCRAEQSESAAAPTPTQTPKEALLASVPDGSEGPFRFTGKDAGTDVAGELDPAAKAMHLTTAVKDAQHGFTTNLGFLVIDQQTWMQVSFTGTKGLTGLPKLPRKWLKLDPTKITDPGSAPRWEGADPGNAGPVIEAATSVEDKGAGQYAGTVDLTSGEAAKVLDADVMKALGAAAAAIPFRAEVGADRNLASLTLDIPAAGTVKAYTYTVVYRDYGKAPKVTAPAVGQAQEAPALAYDLLNG